MTNREIINKQLDNLQKVFETYRFTREDKIDNELMEDIVNQAIGTIAKIAAQHIS